MISISQVKENFNNKRMEYSNNVAGKNATTYENSLVYQQDNSFLEFFGTFISDITNFQRELYNIKNACPSNYTNTIAELEGLSRSIGAGSDYFQDISTTIKAKSIQVYEEFSEKFNANKNMYDTNSARVAKLINSAQEAQNKLDNEHPSPAIKQADGTNIDNPNYLPFITKWKRARDNALEDAIKAIEWMDKCIKSMLEILEKGLKKSA